MAQLSRADQPVDLQDPHPRRLLTIRSDSATISEATSTLFLNGWRIILKLRRSVPLRTSPGYQIDCAHLAYRSEHHGPSSLRSNLESLEIESFARAPE